MIESHPKIISVVLLIIAILAHIIKTKYSPIKARHGPQGTWFALEKEYDDSSIYTFRTFTGIKWAAIGALLTIQIQFPFF
jgi:hypothetical protein